MEYTRHTALMRMVGLGGVASEENERAKLWGRRFEGPMVLAAIWILIDWYLQSKGVSNAYTSFRFRLANLAIVYVRVVCDAMAG